MDTTVFQRNFSAISEKTRGTKGITQLVARERNEVVYKRRKFDAGARRMAK